MAFSALLDSFNHKTPRKQSSEPAYIQEPSKKRRKLDDILLGTGSPIPDHLRGSELSDEPSNLDFMVPVGTLPKKASKPSPYSLHYNVDEAVGRFNEEFGPGTHSKPFPESKPDDFKEFFCGNSDDMFRIGIKLTRKTIKLFSNFYHSDIIIASPLGLKAVVSGTGKEADDTDFLSSIELLYVDSTDGLLMQNWDHVDSIFSSLNQMPKEAHGCDFSRVRNWYLDGNASKFRQTIVSGLFSSPEINSALSKYCNNHSGFIKFHDICSGELSSHISQVFTRIESPDPPNDPDIRFEHFTRVTLPLWEQNGMTDKGGLLVFLSSYLDFVRIRNYFAKTGQTVGEINEYSSPSSVTRSRAYFLSGRHKILLYTERAHHFRRYTLKGVLNIFMYNIPTNPVFYRELVNFLRESITNGKANLEESKVRVTFTQWDTLKAERIVGSIGYNEMKKDKTEGSVDFEFP
ncbi:hypothetical protein ABW20_dc0103083 [Dactylellina cionopaga]|nr:hypothetical protein ABW20_dc0103083 [Dactylellina cionopaga]